MFKTEELYHVPMTEEELRDIFAAHALIANATGGLSIRVEEMAEYAYYVADAMLLWRQKPKCLKCQRVHGPGDRQPCKEGTP